MQCVNRSASKTSWTDQLDGSAGQTSWTDQLDRPAGWTSWTDQLDGPEGQTSWTDQFFYLKPCPVRIFEDFPSSLYIVAASESDEDLVYFMSNFFATLFLFLLTLLFVTSSFFNFIFS